MIGFFKVGRQVGVGCAQVGMEGRNDGGVSLVGEVQRARAVGVRFEGFDGVVDYWVGMEVLSAR